VGILLILPPRTSSSQARSQLNPGQTHMLLVSAQLIRAIRA